LLVGRKILSAATRRSPIDASWTKARQLAASLSYRVATRRHCLILLKNRPTRLHIQAMNPTCSVLLDLDGTLIDSQPGILASCLAALRALGHAPDETLDIKRAIGPPLEDMMRVLLQPYGDDRVGEAAAAYRQH
jgi:hypothetical protein